MRWIDLDMAGSHNPSRYPQISNEQLYNFFISKQSVGNCLFPTAGYEIYNNNSNATNPRGLFYSTILGGLLAVFGKYVYLYRTQTSIPTILNPNLPFLFETGTVFISENFINQVVISDTDSVYVFILNDDNIAVTRAAIPDGVVPGMITFQDSYFILNDSSSNKFYISQNNNGAAWEVLDFGEINSKTVGVAAVNRQLLILGEYETGVFYDAGVVPFPYQRSNTFAIDYGCLSRDSVAVGFNRVCWLGTNKQSDPVLLVSTGGAPKMFESENIDFKIDDLENPQNCEGFLYQLDGHIFYQINFYSDDLSLLYDFSNNVFSAIIENDIDYSRVQYLTSGDNKTLCLLRAHPFIYELSNKIPTNNGRQIPRIRITKNYYFDKVVEVPAIRVWAQQGIYKNPENESLLRLSISHDGGATFGESRQIELATLADRQEFLQFESLGSSYRWAFKFEFISDYPVAVINAKALVKEVEGIAA